MADSTPASSSSRRSRQISLPDLTDRLIEAGVYDEYCVYREGYLRWRRGEAKGARGEVNQICPFEELYPTADVFVLRRMLAYWMLTVTVIGGFFMAFAGFFSTWGVREDLMQPLADWPNLLGIIYFTIGAMLLYAQQWTLNKVANRSASNKASGSEEEFQTPQIPDLRHDELESSVISVKKSMVLSFRTSLLSPKRGSNMNMDGERERYHEFRGLPSPSDRRAGEASPTQTSKSTTLNGVSSTRASSPLGLGSNIAENSPTPLTIEIKQLSSHSKEIKQVDLNRRPSCQPMAKTISEQSDLFVNDEKSSRKLIVAWESFIVNRESTLSGGSVESTIAQSGVSSHLSSTANQATSHVASSIQQDIAIKNSKHIKPPRSRSDTLASTRTRRRNDIKDIVANSGSSSSSLSGANTKIKVSRMPMVRPDCCDRASGSSNCDGGRVRRRGPGSGPNPTPPQENALSDGTRIFTAWKNAIERDRLRYNAVLEGKSNLMLFKSDSQLLRSLIETQDNTCIAEAIDDVEETYRRGLSSGSLSGLRVAPSSKSLDRLDLKRELSSNRPLRDNIQASKSCAAWHASDYSNAESFSDMKQKGRRLPLLLEQEDKKDQISQSLPANHCAIDCWSTPAMQITNSTSGVEVSNIRGGSKNVSSHNIFARCGRWLERIFFGPIGGERTWAAWSVLSVNVGCILYLIGNIACCVPFKSVKEPRWFFLLFIYCPFIIGGVLFVAFGVLEVIINKDRPLFWTPELWCGIVDTIGGTMFCTGSWLMETDIICAIWSPGATIWHSPDNPEDNIDYAECVSFLTRWCSGGTFFIGAWCYVFTAFIGLQLWQVEKFGWGVICKLNNIHRSSRKGKGPGKGTTVGGAVHLVVDLPEETGLSAGTLGMIMLYCFILTLCYMNACTLLRELHSYDFLIGMGKVCYQLIVIIFCHLLLLLHSDLTTLPKIQPYRLIVQSMRFLFSCCCILESCTFLNLLINEDWTKK